MRTFWSEGRCRHDGTARVPPAASGERKVFSRIFLPRSCGDACGARIFRCPRVRAARRALIVYNGVQVEETEQKGILMILVPNALFVVMFAVLAVMAALMLRRGVVAEVVCAAVAAVGCALPLVAIGLAPAAREGDTFAAAVVVAAYILAYVFAFGGAAGMFVFSRARVQAALDDVEGEGK